MDNTLPCLSREGAIHIIFPYLLFLFLSILSWLLKVNSPSLYLLLSLYLISHFPFFISYRSPLFDLGGMSRMIKKGKKGRDKI